MYSNSFFVSNFGLNSGIGKLVRRIPSYLRFKHGTRALRRISTKRKEEQLGIWEFGERARGTILRGLSRKSDLLGDVELQIEGRHLVVARGSNVTRTQRNRIAHGHRSWRIGEIDEFESVSSIRQNLLGSLGLGRGERRGPGREGRDGAPVEGSRSVLGLKALTADVRDGASEVEL